MSTSTQRGSPASNRANCCMTTCARSMRIKKLMWWSPRLIPLSISSSSIVTICLRITPIVFVAVERPSPQVLAAGPGLTGIIRANTHRKTLDLALNLHPDTKEVFVISGTPEHDKRFETISRKELAGYEKRVRLTYLTDLPLHELMERVKELPQNSFILYVWHRSALETEKSLQTFEVLEKI